MARFEIREIPDKLIVKILSTGDETLKELEKGAKKFREAVIKEQKKKKMYFEISPVMQRHVLYIFFIFIKIEDSAAREAMKKVIKNCW